MTYTTDEDYDGVQYDTFNGPQESYRCVLCGDVYPRRERLNDASECIECVRERSPHWLDRAGTFPSVWSGR